MPSSGRTAEKTSREVSARSAPEAVRIATHEITAMLPTLTATIPTASHLRVDASDDFAEFAMASDPSRAAKPCPAAGSARTPRPIFVEVLGEYRPVLDITGPSRRGPGLI